MGPAPDASSDTHRESAELRENEGQQLYDIDPATVDQDRDAENASDAPISEAMSPGSKIVQEIEDGRNMHSVEDTPVKLPFKKLERPISSGEHAEGPPRYQMKAAIFRSVQVKRPKIPQKQPVAGQVPRIASPEGQVSLQTKLQTTDTK